MYIWVLKLIKFVNRLPKFESNNILGKQLIRSGTSILGNYIESSAASSKKDFINFFNYSLKSANESKIWLSLIVDTNKFAPIREEAKILLKELKELSNIIAKSIITLKNSN